MLPAGARRDEALAVQAKDVIVAEQSAGQLGPWAHRQVP